MIPIKINIAKSNVMTSFEPLLPFEPILQDDYLFFRTEKMEIIIPCPKKLVFLIRLTIVNLFLPF